MCMWMRLSRVWIALCTVVRFIHSLLSTASLLLYWWFTLSNRFYPIFFSVIVLVSQIERRGFVSRFFLLPLFFLSFCGYEEKVSEIFHKDFFSIISLLRLALRSHLCTWHFQNISFTHCMDSYIAVWTVTQKFSCRVYFINLFLLFSPVLIKGNNYCCWGMNWRTFLSMLIEKFLCEFSFVFSKS